MQLTLQLERSIIFKIKRAIMNEEKNKITQCHFIVVSK